MHDDTRLLSMWVLGGDDRYPWAVKALRKSGLRVKTWGVPHMPDDCGHLEEALREADLVLLPMKPFQGELLKLGDAEIEAALLPRKMKKGAILMAGDIPTDIEGWLQSQGIQVRSFLDAESYQMANAAVTAEGAVYLAMRELNRTISGGEFLVIGWGRIGRFLGTKLQALGGRVTVTARKEGQWAEIESMGMRPEETGRYHHGLGDYDAVFNTVPSQVMDEAQFRSLKPGCLLVELASQPGGFAQEIMEKGTVLVARGLPGKTAPETAGENLSAGVWACLTGEGRTLE